MKACALKVYSAKLKIHKVCIRKIRNNVVLLTPAIPSCNALLENFQMLRICHACLTFLTTEKEQRPHT